MKPPHPGYGPRADFCWQQDHLTLGHPPAFTAASDAAVHVTFSCTHTTAHRPCCRQVTQMILIQRKKSVSFLDRYFQSSALPHGQERDGTALLLSWKWMAGSRQKLIKLALAKDMNCGITPWIASNHIFPCSAGHEELRWVSACNETQFLNFHKKINTHQTLRFLLKFY